MKKELFSASLNNLEKILKDLKKMEKSIGVISNRETKQFARGLQEATKELQAVSGTFGKIEASMRRVGGGLMNSITSGIKRMGSALTKGGKMGIAGIFATIASAKMMGDDARSKEFNARVLGIKEQEIRGLEHAGKLSGGGKDLFTGMLGSIRDILAGDVDGASALLQTAGVDMQTAKSMNQVDLLKDVIKGIQNNQYSDQLVKQFAGDLGLDVNQIKAIRLDDFDKAFKEGKTIAPQNTDELKKFSDNIDNLTRELSGLGISIMNDLTPTLLQLIEWFKSAMPVIKEWGGYLADAFKSLSEVTKELIEKLANFWNGLTNFGSNLKDSVVNGFKNLFDFSPFKGGDSVKDVMGATATNQNTTTNTNTTQNITIYTQSVDRDIVNLANQGALK